jgi:hypothetical protein
VVLTYADIQHTSHAVASLCTARHVRAYLADGRLPAVGTVCEADEPAFAEAPPAGLAPADRAVYDALVAFGRGPHGAT